MRYYPKISGPKDAPMEHCIAFEKLDGSNIVAVWSKKRGFSKFGTRRRMFDQTDADFGSAVGIFMNSHSEALSKLFVDNDKYRHSDNNAMNFVYSEFLGQNSFAGQHKPEDLKKMIVIDVWIHKKGFVTPWDFVKDFSSITQCAKKIYEGKFTGKLVSDVREGKYNVEEGVVCKGGKESKDVWMTKIKTNSYMKKLQEVYVNNWKDYWE